MYQRGNVARGRLTKLLNMSRVALDQTDGKGASLSLLSQVTITLNMSIPRLFTPRPAGAVAYPRYNGLVGIRGKRWELHPISRRVLVWRGQHFVYKCYFGCLCLCAPGRRDRRGGGFCELTRRLGGMFKHDCGQFQRNCGGPKQQCKHHTCVAKQVWHRGKSQVCGIITHSSKDGPQKQAQCGEEAFYLPTAQQGCFQFSRPCHRYVG